LYYNWLLNQLIPAFIVKKEEKEEQTIVYFNMKVGDFSPMLSAQNVKLESNSNNLYSDKWDINATKIDIKSNLDS
jgi:hypothetical protein